MYNNSLIFCLEDENIETDDFKYSYEDNICGLCGEKYQKGYLTYLYNDKIKTKSCYLCKTIVNFSSNSMGKCMLVSSELEQIEINKKILEYVKRNNEMPKPKELDENCKLVNISIFNFLQCYTQMEKSEKKKFDHIKIVFTNEAINYLKSTEQNFFSKDSKKSKSKYDSSYFNLETYEFTKTEQKIIDKKNDLINTKNKLTSVQKSLKNKLNEVKSFSFFIDSLKKNSN